MNPNNIPSASPSQLLPPNLLRGGQTTPGQIFQQDPLATGMSPSAMGADPSVMQQPQAGSQAGNPSMPQMPPMQSQPPAGMPGQQDPQISEAQYILNALTQRLAHHSSITSKTINTLSKMIESGLPLPDQQVAPTA